MSTFFSATNLRVLPFWVLIIVAPRWRITERIARSPLIVLGPVIAGMQFAKPEAVERLRSAPESGFVLLNTRDPASPYCDDRIRRRPSNQVLLQNGVPLLYTESHGSRWWILGDAHTAIPAFLERWTGDPLTVEEINGLPAAESPLAPAASPAWPAALCGRVQPIEPRTIR